MHYLASTLVFPLLALGVSAQSMDSLDMEMTPSPTMTSVSSQATCLAACSPEDVTCRAACVSVPFPNTAQVNQTNACAAACPKGDGSKAESDAYASCLDGCISSYYVNGANATPTSGDASGTSNGASRATGGSTTSSNSNADSSDSNADSSSNDAESSPSDAAPSTAAPDNAAAAKTIVSAGGLLGVFAAFLLL